MERLNIHKLLLFNLQRTASTLNPKLRTANESITSNEVTNNLMFVNTRKYNTLSTSINLMSTTHVLCTK